ncbi:MAG: M23 family metallopeptidase [Acutalibacteraceae bacterium]
MDRKKSDYLVKTVLIQTATCIVLFGILFGLKQTQSKVYYEIKEEFFDNLDSNILGEEIADVFINTKSKLINQTASDELTTKKTSEETTDKDNTENKETDKTEAESETEYKPLEEPSLNAEIIAEGGVDVSVSSEDEVPSNVSLNSYKINQTMIKPVINAKTTSKFGIRTHPITNKISFHAGIDLAAPVNTPIYAAFDGKVTVADYDQWNGNYIKIQHDNGIMTVYCHCEKINVKKGQVIKAGEVIGYVGSTGSSTGPHLHFELRINNISYNPETALKGAKNAI